MDTITFEYMYNGVVLLKTTVAAKNLYFEAIDKYSIACASIVNFPKVILTADNLQFGTRGRADRYVDPFDTCFFFGTGVFVNIRGVTSATGTALFVDNSGTPDRVISFANSISGAQRYYSPDITFIDESPTGKNIGSIFVNPNSVHDTITNPYPGSDQNYGFSVEDPVQTFDAALFRVQNQGTLNPIKVIYIRAALNCSESVQVSEGAVYKNTSIVPIENCNILITSYGSSETHLRGRIYFEGDDDLVAIVGQIELLGNVSLYFRNVDLVCNTPSISSIYSNLSLFGLRNSYARLTFESNFVIDYFSSYLFNIDMSGAYFLAQANYSVGTMGKKSLLDIKFINIIINTGGGLSPYQEGYTELGIDCTQINSFRSIAGWTDVITIRDNF